MASNDGWGRGQQVFGAIRSRTGATSTTIATILVLLPLLLPLVILPLLQPPKCYILWLPLLATLLRWCDHLEKLAADIHPTRDNIRTLSQNNPLCAQWIQEICCAGFRNLLHQETWVLYAVMEIRCPVAIGTVRLWWQRFCVRGSGYPSAIQILCAQIWSPWPTIWWTFVCSEQTVAFNPIEVHLGENKHISKVCLGT